MKRTDSERLDWLEKMAREKNGLLLHAETEITGRTGLGLGQPDRSLRAAVDQAMGDGYDAAAHSAAYPPY